MNGRQLFESNNGQSTNWANAPKSIIDQIQKLKKEHPPMKTYSPPKPSGWSPTRNLKPQELAIWKRELIQLMVAGQNHAIKKNEKKKRQKRRLERMKTQMSTAPRGRRHGMSELTPKERNTRNVV